MSHMYIFQLLLVMYITLDQSTDIGKKISILLNDSLVIEVYDIPSL